MVNYMNYFTGFMGFITGMSLMYLFWTPVLDILTFFPTSLYVPALVFFIALMVTVGFWIPQMLMVADDAGR